MGFSTLPRTEEENVILGFLDAGRMYFDTRRYPDIQERHGSKAIEKMKYYLTSPELTCHFDISYSGTQASKHCGTTYFMWICGSGDLEFVKYLLTSPDIKIPVNINDNGFYDSPLSCAVRSGNLDLVMYMLTSPELKVHAQIMPRNYSLTKERGKIFELVKTENWPLEAAFKCGNIEMIDCLLQSPDLKEHAKLTSDIVEDLEANQKYELLEHIKQKGYIIEEHDNSYYTPDENGVLVPMIF